MTENLTTRDVFQQLDARLSRVEDDVRSLRSEMQAGFQALRDEVRAAAQDLRSEMNQRFDRLSAMFVSLMIGYGALALGIAGIWLKL